MTDGGTLGSVTDFLDDRYGRTHRPAWIFPAAAGALIVVATAWSVWAALGQVDDPVSARVFGYSVVNDNATKVTIEVQRDDDNAAVLCTITARGRDHSVVGEKTLDVPTTADNPVRVSTTVETQRRAVAATVDGCILAP